jgi:glyoxylase-like metal-dependent hydrolase (beta-lactamase superfamily II)
VHIEQIRTGGDRNFGYLLVDTGTGEAAAIDPSFTPEEIVGRAEAQGWVIRYAFCTHDHHDHSNGNDGFRRLTGIPVLLLGDVEPRSGRTVEDGSRFHLAQHTITVLHTPGHTADSICLYVDEAVFTGDTLFVGKVGGTGFGDDAEQEYASLHDKLLALPDNCTVYPGHDYGIAPTTTIGHEKRTNPFLLQSDFASFLHLKKTWAEYKKAHGIA